MLLNYLILVSAFCYWLYIMHFQFLIYLVQEEATQKLLKGITSENTTLQQ